MRGTRSKWYWPPPGMERDVASVMAWNGHSRSGSDKGPGRGPDVAKKINGEIKGKSRVWPGICNHRLILNRVDTLSCRPVAFYFLLDI